MIVAYPTRGKQHGLGYQHFHPVPLSFGYDPSYFVITYVISACLKTVSSIFFIFRGTQFELFREMAFA